MAAAVLAVALGAVLMLVREQVAHAQALRSGTLAHWIAIDRVHELRVAQDWPAIGVRRGEVQQGTRRWHWVETVRAGADPALRVVSVEVREQATGPVVAQGHGWLARVP